jgi:hypothetical protein
MGDEAPEDKIMLIVVALLISGRFEPEQCAGIALKVVKDIEEVCSETNAPG